MLHSMLLFKKTLNATSTRSHREKTYKATLPLQFRLLNIFLEYTALHLNLHNFLHSNTKFQRNLFDLLQRKSCFPFAPSQIIH